jgi:uncharacterized DUF497 family protein
MARVRFEWDEAKNRINRNKHGISFETAIRIFADPFALSEPERIEDGERRWLPIGAVENYQVLVVAHTTRENDDDGDEIEIIRIITSRKANRAEKRRYAEERR